jgi:hypothetical protein
MRYGDWLKKGEDKMEKYKIKVTSVDYCVEQEDVCWQFDNDTELEEDSEEYYNAIDNEIKKISKINIVC